MKKILRTKVFETNSSATSTLVVDPKGLSKNKLKMKDGYVIADFGQFGDYSEGPEVYKSQNDKLSYLLSELFYVNHYDENIEDMYQFKYILKAIQEIEPTVIGIKIKHKTAPSLNHQIQPEYSDSRYVNYWDKQSIINFLFNKYIWFEIDHD